MRIRTEMRITVGWNYMKQYLSPDETLGATSGTETENEDAKVAVKLMTKTLVVTCAETDGIAKMAEKQTTKLSKKTIYFVTELRPWKGNVDRVIQWTLTIKKT